MEIQITVEDYFKELKLMEEHYGQEEDLYPWIYMLLQMAECKRKENKKKLGEEYKYLSIRDTHNWKKKHAPIDMDNGKRKCILNMISSEDESGNENGGAPEFLILDEETKYYLGCVEIKTLNDKKWTSLKKGEHEELNVLVSKERKKETFKDVSDFDIDSKIQEIECNLNKKDIICIKYRRYQNVYNIDIYTVCDEENVEVDREVMWYYEYKQLEHHLRRFGKVLYTNGLEFYLIGKGNNKGYNIEKLGNLKSMYTKYRNSGFKLEGENKSKAEEEWETLKNQLAEINWYEACVKINEGKKLSDD